MPPRPPPSRRRRWCNDSSLVVVAVVAAMWTTTSSTALECPDAETRGPERAVTEKRLPVVFIDLGANYGSSLERAVEKGIITKPSQTEVYAFEPNPKFKRELRALMTRQGFGYGGLVQAPAFVRDEETVFYLDERPLVYSRNHKSRKPLKYDAAGSSLFDRKNAEQRPVEGTELRVCALRFADWLDANVGAQNHTPQTVIVKMDIEGAEFDVLEDLLKTKAITLIDHLYIEWHGLKIRPDLCCRRPSGTGPPNKHYCGSTCPLETALTTAIRERGVDVHLWDE